jgi:integrase
VRKDLRSKRVKLCHVMRIPKYCRHSTRDLAFVTWKRKRYYLPGKYDSPQSQAAYKAFIRQVVTVDHACEPPSSKSLTVAGLIMAYLDHAAARYSSGSRTEYANAKYALGPLLKSEHGPVFATEFGPRRLKAYRNALVPKHSRGYINQQLAKIRRAFKWAASEELIPVAVYQALATVPGLRAGETEARETSKRRPVSWVDVEPVLLELSPEVADMVRIQWHTACRSGSLCRATSTQFDRLDPELWLWRPRHKTELAGRELIIPIGPLCQKILRPYVDQNAADVYLFSPRAQRANRRYGKRYTSTTYYQAIRRAIERVNAKRLLADPEAKLLEPWFPHQLRHSKGQMIRERFGIEGAQAHLGHDSMEATEIYSARRLELAKQIALETG